MQSSSGSAARERRARVIAAPALIALIALGACSKDEHDAGSKASSAATASASTNACASALSTAAASSDGAPSPAGDVVLRTLDLGDELKVEILREGGPPAAEPGDTLLVRYEGRVKEASEAAAPAPSDTAAPAPKDTAVPASSDATAPASKDTAAPAPGDAAASVPKDTAATVSSDATAPASKDVVAPTPTDAAAATPSDTTAPAKTDTAPSPAKQDAQPPFATTRGLYQPQRFVLDATSDARPIPGLARALVGLQQGTRARVHVPAALAYGKAGLASSGVPADAALVFEIEIVEVRP